MRISMRSYDWKYSSIYVFKQGSKSEDLGSKNKYQSVTQ